MIITKIHTRSYSRPPYAQYTLLEIEGPDDTRPIASIDRALNVTLVPPSITLPGSTGLSTHAPLLTRVCNETIGGPPFEEGGVQSNRT